MFLKIARVVALAGLAVLADHSVLPQGQPPVPGNFPLQVNGLVRYAVSRRPAENVLVRIESFGGGLISQITTDRGGKFSFTGLTAMQYIITVHAPGFRDARENVDLLTANTAYLNIDLVEDRKAAATDPAGTLTNLKVLDANIPTDAQKEFAKAKALLDSGDAKAAAKSLESAVRIYPKYLEAELMLGLVYMDLQDWTKAEACLKKALEIDANASTAQFALSEVYLRQNKLSLAEGSAVNGLKLAPLNARGHLALAKAYWQEAPATSSEQEFRTKAEGAWKEVSRALELDSNLAEAHIVAGNLLLRARRGKDALAHFETYLKLEPNGPFAKDAKDLVKKLKESLDRSDKQS
jgi:tetratricopeptide (TPR) repeat protein